MTTISIDLMGGDHGPSVIVAGAAIALERHPSIKYQMFGLEDECLKVLDEYPAVKAVSEFLPDFPDILKSLNFYSFNPIFFYRSIGVLVRYDMIFRKFIRIFP